MGNKHILFVLFLISVSFFALAQNSVFSPYSRFGIGEIAPSTFAHNAGMGGAFIALKPDSTMPIFVNAGNPAAYSLIRLTTLEVGGTYLSSKFTGVNNSTVTKWGTNFSYASIGFPIRGNGGACFGIAPYSYVGYETQSTSTIENVGRVTYKYNGNGGLTKAYIGYGIMPFNKRLRIYKSNRLYIADSLKTLSNFQYKTGEIVSKLLSDFSLGFNANYIFGNIQNSTRVIYPSSSLYYNTVNYRTMSAGDFTGNFGAQTALTFDSVKDSKKRNDKIKAIVETFRTTKDFSEAELKLKEDSLAKYLPSYKRAMKEKTKLTFGYFLNIGNTMSATYSSISYNYILNALGQELIRDTAYSQINEHGKITLPLEQGFGLGFKKGERVNVVADFAITNWENFKYFNEVNALINNYRLAAGINFVPEKYAAGNGAYIRRINYRLGVSYQTGYIELQNSVVSNYSFSAGIGLPVGIGRLSSMVNISAQYGRMGSDNPTLLSENYWKITFGFTFCDKWFQKFKYD